MTQEQLNLQLFRAVREGIRNNNLEAIKKAIEDGADINATDWSGQTPLEIAELYEHTEIIELLKHHGGISMNTIILPDHIRFEELIKEWCYFDYEAIYYCSTYKQYEFVTYIEVDEDYKPAKDVLARFCPNSRTLTLPYYNSKRELDRVLDYIKERSNV